MRLVQLYAEHIRPYAALADENEETARFFIKADGQPDELLERHVTSLFLALLDVHITTTTIRHMVDTTAQDLHLRGGMDAAQLDGVLFVQGHSNATSRNYYTQ